MTLSTRLQVDLRAEQSTPYGASAAAFSPRASYSKLLRSGVDAGQADKLYQGRRTIIASANEDLDLAGNVLTDAFGQPITFGRVKGLLVVAAESNTNNVVVGGAAANGWVGPFGAAAHTVAVAPGEVVLLTKSGATGWPVVAGTGDLLRVANSGAGSSVTYDITLWGASA